MIFCLLQRTFTNAQPRIAVRTWLSNVLLLRYSMMILRMLANCKTPACNLHDQTNIVYRTVSNGFVLFVRNAEPLITKQFALYLDARLVYREVRSKLKLVTDSRHWSQNDSNDWTVKALAMQVLILKCFIHIHLYMFNMIGTALK